MAKVERHPTLRADGMKREPLFNPRVLRGILAQQRALDHVPSDDAIKAAQHWSAQLKRGVLTKLTESSAEQTFNDAIFGTLLGYSQLGVSETATMMPKRSAGRNTPDFVLGFFDPPNPDRWTAVGEIKDARTDLDQPQIGRRRNETPVEQAFRYAGLKAGVSWIVVTNLKELRLYRNGYSVAYHSWNLEDLADEGTLLEFYLLLRPEGLLELGKEPLATRAFNESISAGRDLTEGFYGLYKTVQQELIRILEPQVASKGFSTTQLYGKTHKLLNRILFVAFCEDHPAELVPRDTLKNLAALSHTSPSPGVYWRNYRTLFQALNVGGGVNGVALNAFNGGLFSRDRYFDQVAIENEAFERRFQSGKGRRRSADIVGVFGFQVYDFAEDLNEQALGAIFEQSLKDITKGLGSVRGKGEVNVTNQQVGGVYYTPREITTYLISHAFSGAFDRLMRQAEAEVDAGASAASKPMSPRRRQISTMDAYQRLLAAMKVMDLACGSGAFLVEALIQLQAEQEKTNRALAELRGNKRQRSLMDLDRLILQKNLYGRDILPESVEISRLSIWLRTARRGEKLESLDKTITVGDSLRAGAGELYEVIVGNPPWGADMEGWSTAELQAAFPDAGEEKDSYAVFVIRAWQLLVPGGMLGFIVPNSWLTTDGYTAFRSWLIRSFEIVEIANVWKIFRDVNHDATMIVARKRPDQLETAEIDDQSSIRIRALARGSTESSKLRQLAEEVWSIDHRTSLSAQAAQHNHRFEVIYPPKVAEELDVIIARCRRLDEVSDVTVGIQAYHHTKVEQHVIQGREFHSSTRIGHDWHPFVDANDVQRYFVEPQTTQWLRYSDLLRDKRELNHYRLPRILVQQIFWRRMSAELQTPTNPLLYMNTLFAVYNSRGVELPTILGLLNSRFMSAIYERLANRLFGDKFPKVSKLDLARLPIPIVSTVAANAIGRRAVGLQQHWSLLREAFRDANGLLASASPNAGLGQYGQFWTMSEGAFRTRSVELFGPLTPSQWASVSAAYRRAKHATDKHWPEIDDIEDRLEDGVRKAYRVSEKVYASLIERAPKPEVTWALRPD